MVTGIVNFLSQAFSSTNNVRNSTAVTPVSSNNPFANPFVSSSSHSNMIYAKNKPVQGGYFAGYHNGKSNIVGQRLFIEA